MARQPIPLATSLPSRLWHLEKLRRALTKVARHNAQGLEDAIEYHASRLRTDVTKTMQLIASGNGILPQQLLDVTSISWSRLGPVMFEAEARAYMEQDYQRRGWKSLDDIFSSIDFKRPKSASFATVYKGTLNKAITGEEMPVAIKVLYPGVRDVLSTDFNYMRFLVKAGSFLQSITKIPIIGKAISNLPGFPDMEVPRYAPRVLQEIMQRCLEELNPENEALNMVRSFCWYQKLFSAVDTLDDTSYIKRTLTTPIPAPLHSRETFKSHDDVLHLAATKGFMHPLPYVDEFGRPNLCTDNILVMDHVPGVLGTDLLDAQFSKPLRRSLADRMEVLGLVSMHPHAIMAGTDDKKYDVHSDIHPGNTLVYSSPQGMWIGIIDFGNVQQLDFKHSRNMLEVVRRTLEGCTAANGGELSAVHKRRIAQAYIQAGIVDTIDDPAIERYLIPFNVTAEQPYLKNQPFNYANTPYFTSLNRMMWDILFSPTIKATGDRFWMHRCMFLHFNALYRMGSEVDSYTPMHELLSYATKELLEGDNR